MTEDEVRKRVEALVVEAGSLRELARRWDVSPSYLSDFLNGRRGPGPQILGPLGLVADVVVRYVPGKTTGRKRRSVRERSSCDGRA
jgi:transcriptional regulator with XRE-family HTH domain